MIKEGSGQRRSSPGCEERKGKKNPERKGWRGGAAVDPFDSFEEMFPTQTETGVTGRHHWNEKKITVDMNA